MSYSDYFTLFGLSKIYTQDLQVIKARFYQLQKKSHPDNFINATPQEKRLSVEQSAMINEAFKTLTDPIKRATYLLKCHGIDCQSETDTSMPESFLIEQMELRENIHEASTKEKVESALKAFEQQLSEYLDKSPNHLSEARLVIRKMFFYAKLREELE